MASIMGIDTAIGWAHWKVRGGWKNALLTTGAYVGVIVLVIVMTVRMDPRSGRMILGGWLSGLLFLQGGLLVLLAGTRVSAAVRTDINSRMIESHRLMPVSPWVAITGYLWGPPSQSIFMAAATFMIGLVVAMAAGITPEAWIRPTIVLVTFAVFFWVVMAYLASIVRAPAAVVVTAVFVMLVFQGMPLHVFPGFMVLLTPFMGRTIFQLSAGGVEFDWPILCSWVLQVWMGVALYIGAARKYRRAEDSALAILPGIMLLAGWIGVNALAMRDWDDFAIEVRIWDWLPDGLSFEASIMGSLCSSILLALVPVSNAAQRPRSAIVMILVALGCALMIAPMGLAWAYRIQDAARAVLVTGSAVWALLVSCGYVLKIAYRFSTRGMVPLIIWLVVTCMFPLMIDHLLWSLSETIEDFQMTWIASLSPVGAMAMAWFDGKAPALPGVIALSGCAVGWGMIYHLTQRRRPSPIPIALPDR